MSDTFVSGFFFGLLIAGIAAFTVWAALRRRNDDTEIGLDAWQEDYADLHYQEPQVVTRTNIRERKVQL